MTLGNTRVMFLTAFILLVTELLAFKGLNACPGVPMDENQYEYRENVQRRVAVVREEGIYFGHLDARGTFVPLPGEKPRAGYLSGPGIINSRMTPDESVYEFRSGTLIKGKFDDKLNFVPEVGSAIIAFKDYRYGKDALRIYNLPGKFVEKKNEKQNGEERKK